MEGTAWAKYSVSRLSPYHSAFSFQAIEPIRKTERAHNFSQHSVIADHILRNLKKHNQSIIQLARLFQGLNYLTNLYIYT